jgi:hypothetical protein
MMLAQYQDLVLPSLRRLVKHQRQHDLRQRYESRFLHSVVDQLRWQGIDLPARPGPWTIGARWLKGPGRGGLPVIPLVQRANTVVMTDTWDEARRLAGLLNWCHAPSLPSPARPRGVPCPASVAVQHARSVRRPPTPQPRNPWRNGLTSSTLRPTLIRSPAIPMVRSEGACEGRTPGF